MPVGTLATVKSLSTEDLTACGAEIILGNTYHLYLRPGCDVIGQFSGLHRFMNWHGPILTDSGGFQIFSLARLRRITDEGADFQSHIDGSRHMLTPEKTIEIQLCLNADIVMCLDQCIAFPSSRDETMSAMDLTTRWAKRCQNFFRLECHNQNLLFGIVQGGMEPDLRAASADALVEMGFNGYAIGGLSVGRTFRPDARNGGCRNRPSARFGPPVCHGRGHTGEPGGYGCPGCGHVRLRSADP